MADANNIKTSNNSSRMIDSSRVGGTIGERKVREHLPPPPQRTVAKATDQFEAQKRANNVDQFSSNATFKNSRKVSSDTPYKFASHDQLEKGVSGCGNEHIAPPSDQAILNFLDQVIENPVFHNPRAIQKAMALKQAQQITPKKAATKAPSKTA